MAQSIDTTYTGILKNETIGLSLALEGYVVFPFLDRNDIQQLIDYYHSVQPQTPEYFYSSTHSPDHSFRRKSSDFIKKIIANRLPDHLKSYQLLGGAFVVKPAHGKGILPPHQDWNLVDETVTRSYNLWIPLVDVNVSNGAVFVLPQSHNKIPTYRGPGISSIFKNIEQEVWKTLVPLEMKQGEVLLYDHALLHASPVNKTDQIRLGIVCGVIPENVSMQMYFGTDGIIQSYKVNEDFFLDKDPMKGPDGLEIMQNIHHPISLLDVESYGSLYLNRLGIKKRNWLFKLLGKNK